MDVGSWSGVQRHDGLTRGQGALQPREVQKKKRDAGQTEMSLKTMFVYSLVFELPDPKTLQYSRRSSKFRVVGSRFRTD